MMIVISDVIVKKKLLYYTVMNLASQRKIMHELYMASDYKTFL